MSDRTPKDQHTNDTLGRQQRYRGALVGLAVGDALGTTLEFTRPGQFTPITDMVGGGPFGLTPGQWTDDTSMALCLAASLIACTGFDAHDQMKRYVQWWRHGYLSSTGHCFDIGTTTSAALARYEQDGNPYAGSTDPHTAGNGSVMRLAPVVLAFAANPALAIAQAAQSSRTTHAAPAAVDGCRFLAALVLTALAGAPKERLLAPEMYLGYDAPALDKALGAIAAGSYSEKAAAQLQSTGYVGDTLEVALWAFATTDTFADGCLRVVNLGGDADTAGAVYGQIAGAFYGEVGIPPQWVERITDHARIVQYADQLLERAASSERH